MILFFGSLLIGYWFWQELRRFPYKINQRIYQDLNQLVPLSFSLNECMQHSSLQVVKSKLSSLLFVLPPLITLFFYHIPLPLILILYLLVYLSLLDYSYYLTDIDYIVLIFILSLANLLFFDYLYYEKLLNLFCVFLFFSLLLGVMKLFKFKEGLGMGDILLLLALSPLFQLEQMIKLLLIASLSGVIFYYSYGVIKKQKLIKIPFIPFISFAFISLMWLEFRIHYEFLN